MLCERRPLAAEVRISGEDDGETTVRYSAGGQTGFPLSAAGERAPETSSRVRAPGSQPSAPRAASRERLIVWAGQEPGPGGAESFSLAMKGPS